jgi:hypothetical protein
MCHTDSEWNINNFAYSLNWNGVILNGNMVQSAPVEILELFFIVAKGEIREEDRTMSASLNEFNHSMIYRAIPTGF